MERHLQKLVENTSQDFASEVMTLWQLRYNICILLMLSFVKNLTQNTNTF